MPDSKTYTGGCHCGQVRFECTSDLSMVTACNCSICTKKGLHFTFLDPKSFQLRAGDENLKEYLFNKHAIHHQLCVDCGVDVFARGKKPDGSDVVALNVSCIDGIELSKLKMTPMDGGACDTRHPGSRALHAGKSWMPGSSPAMTGESWLTSPIQRLVPPENPLLVERDPPVARQIRLDVRPRRNAVAQIDQAGNFRSNAFMRFGKA